MFDMNKDYFNSELSHFDFSFGMNKNIPPDNDVKPLKLSTGEREILTFENHYTMSDSYWLEIFIPIILYILGLGLWDYIITYDVPTYGILDTLFMLGFVCLYPSIGFFGTIIICCGLVIYKAQRNLDYAKDLDRTPENDEYYKKAQGTKAIATGIAVAAAAIAGQIASKKIKKGLRK